MPSSHTRTIWNNGVSLNEAWLELATNDEKRAHAALPEFIGTLATVSELSELFNSALAANEALQRRMQNEKRLKDELLESLFNNQFIATGYIRHPNIRPMPIVIVADTFAGDEKVDWIRSTISNLGVTYDNVRVSEPDAFVARPQKRIGRPGSGEAINRAIDALMNVDPEFCMNNRKIACEKIRNHLGKQATDQSGLSDINLAKYIRRKCPKRVITITR